MSVEDTTNVPTPAREPYVASADDTWTEEPLQELPPRPRRRLLGTGGNPSFLALLGVLLIACGFIGGVLVEKGQTSPSSGTSASGLASRFAALRGAAGAGSTTTGSGSTSTGVGGGGGATGGGGFAGRFGGAGGATIGEVSYISGGTLYVTNAEGNTVKITTSPASTITKTVKADVHGIHPGETVVVRGPKGTNGAVSAESISVSATGVTGGGLGALFGGGGAGGGGSAAGGGGGGGLFGG
ncbi:MAG TPA: hypothetical protein VG147_11615 [Solirubrobacteraceae bacterium]|jgi:hypothetical protein|nr:hypothetical protein [Solirubrobacteraceae bacterium]